jgi:serine/threonine protein kinase
MPLEPGDFLNQRYRIEGRLGKGGMGAVYLAHDVTLDIKVAVKENLNLNPESERQFRREAKLLATLRHANLPRVTDHFILEDRQYLVMDYIEGVDLSARVAKQPATVDEVIGWADAIADALHYLHTRQPPIIHRDIKPANLKLQPSGNVVLVDFGIAKLFDQAQTTTGARGLTPGFSPPEQYGGQRTDSRSDQYALAATLYSLITNKRPADSIQRMLGKETLKPISELHPGVPEHVEVALERGLSLDQEQRFADVQSFRAALSGELALETIRAPLPTMVPTIVPPKPKRRGLWIGLAVGVALIAFAGLGFILTGGLKTILSNASTTDDVIAQVITTTPEATNTSGPPTHTSSPEPSLTPTLEPSPTLEPVILGGGQRIAFISDREDGVTLQIWTMNPDGSDPRQLTFGPGDKSHPRWSPDGTKLLYAAPGGRDEYGNDLGIDIFVMNFDRTGEPTNLTNSMGDDIEPRWSPDGTQMAFTSTRVNELRQVFVIPLACQPAPDTCQSSGQASNLSAGFAVEYSPVWSPNGGTLAVIASINQAPGRIYTRPVEGGDPSIFDLHDRIIGADHLTWSSDSRFLVFSWLVKRGKQEIYIADLQNRGLDPIALTLSLGNKEPAFSPDSQLIAFTSTRDQDPEIYIMTTNGSGQQNLTNNPGRDLQPDWQPLPASP